MPHALRLALVAVCTAVLVGGGARLTAQSPPPVDLPRTPLFAVDPQPLSDALAAASDVAVAADGSVYVADAGADRVVHVSADGTLLRAWGSFGAREGQMVDPTIIAVAPEGAPTAGDVFVASAESGTVHQFSPEGQWVRTVRVPILDGEQARRRIADVAVAPDGSIFVLDAVGGYEQRVRYRAGTTAVIYRFDVEGRYLGTLVPDTSANQTLYINRPSGIDVAADGTVYVADFGNSQVLRFAADGTLLDGVIATNSQEWLSLPLDVAIAPDGSVAVLDTRGTRIQRYAADGTWIEAVQLAESGFEQPPVATGMDIDSDGRLVLSDGGTPRVLRLASDDHPGTAWGRPAEEGLGPVHDVVLHGDGSFTALDSEAMRVEDFGPDGTWWGTRPITENGEPVPAGPAWIDSAPSPESPLYLVREADPAVLELGPDGAVLRRITLPLNAEGEVGSPRDINVLSDGAIALVEDRRSGDSVLGERIMVLEEDGHTRSIVEPTGRGWMKSPLLFSAGPEGTAYVYESGYSGMRRVARYASSGRLLSYWGRQGSGPLEIEEAGGIRALEDGSVLLSDATLGRMQHVDARGRLISLMESEPAGPGHYHAPTGLDVVGDRMVVADAGRLLVHGAQPDDRWRVEAFEDRWFGGWPHTITQTAALDFDWGAGAPLGDPDLPTDGATLRARRQLTVEAGVHRITLRTQGGARLWVGPTLLVDAIDAISVTREVELALSAGTHSVRLDFADTGGSAALHLDLQPLDTAAVTPAPSATPLPTATATNTPAPTTPEPPRHEAYLPVAVRGEAPAEPVVSAPAYHVIDEIDVHHYDLALTVRDVLSGDLEASLLITLAPITDTATVRLDVEPKFIRILEVALEDAIVPHALVPGRPNAHDLTGTRLHVDLGRVARAGEALTLRIDYRISRRAFRETGGFGVVEYRSWHGSDVLATANSPYYARMWLPSNDHVSDPASVSYTLRVPSNVLAAANGRLVEGDYRTGSGLDEEGLRVFRWEQATPVPTLVMTLVIGDLSVEVEDVCFNSDTVNHDRVPCEGAQHRIPLVYYYGPDDPLAARLKTFVDTSAEAMVYYATLFGPYEFEKLGVVNIFLPYNMEYASLIALASETAAVHEVVHHWWGNVVRMGGWGDVWISEGITTYFTSFFDEILGGPPPDVRAVSGNLTYHPEPDPEDAWGFVPYNKGASTLVDLRARMADLAGLAIDDPELVDMFLDVWVDVYQTFRFKNLHTQTLIDHLYQRVPAIMAEHGHPVDRAALDRHFDAWTFFWFETDYVGTESVVATWPGGRMRTLGLGPYDDWLPPLAEVGPIEAPLAWYGHACNREDGTAEPPVMDVTDTIALVERGVCTFPEKLDNARKAGAVAVVMFTDDRPVIAMGCGTDCDRDIRIPATMILRSKGLRLQELLNEGTPVVVELSEFDDGFGSP